MHTPTLRQAAAELAGHDRFAPADDGPVRVWIPSTARPVTAETLAARADVTAAMQANPDGVRRILADVRAAGATTQVDATADATTDALPAHLPRRRRVLTLVGAALTVLGTVLGVQAVGQPRAHAVAVPTSSTIAVTVSGPTARIGVTSASTAAMFADPAGRAAHGVVLQAGDLVLRAAGVERPGARGVALVRIDRVVPSRLLTPGTTTARLVDVGDGRATPVRFVVRRASRVTLDAVLPMPGGYLVRGRAAHYDIPTGTYRGDQQSVVLVQQFVAGAWVTVAQAPTAPDGTVVHGVAAAAASVRVRLVRQVGATVTGGTSTARAAVVPSVGFGGWDW